MILLGPGVIELAKENIKIDNKSVNVNVSIGLFP